MTYDMIDPVTYRLDCSGHLCPVPILMTEEKIKELAPGALLEVIFTDRGAKEDLTAWCKATGHRLLGFKEEKWSASALVEKKKA